MIHEEICTYEVAKLAKEKGFPQDVFGTCEMKSSCYLKDGRYYKDGCIYPIEEAYKRHIFWGSDGHYIEGEYGDEIFDTYELALEDALKYALENLV